VPCLSCSIRPTGSSPSTQSHAGALEGVTLTNVLSTAGSRVCTKTGLSLVRPPSHTIHRIGLTQYDAVNPEVRDRSADREKWSRWDTPGGRTLYAADTAMGAYAEVLPYIRENLPKTMLSTLFPDDDPTDGDDRTTLADQVRAEMPAPTLRDKITQGWRDIRTHYELKITSGGWFVDVLTGTSIQTLNHVFVPAGETVGRMTATDLTGEQRQLTTSVAEWVRNQVLDDGSLPVGIKYQSKHGYDIPAYAIWLRALDDGKSLRSERIRMVTASAVKKDDPDLREVAGWYDLKVL